MLMPIFAVQPAVAADTGFHSPSAEGGNHNQWSNGSNGYASDNQYVSETSEEQDQSFENFNFNVPAGSIIDGIQMRVEGYSSDNSGCRLEPRMYSTSDNEHTDRKYANFNSSDNIYTLGGENDLWGSTWVASDFSNTNFHAEVQYDDGNSNCSNSATTYLDHIQVKVFYHAPPPMPDLVVVKTNNVGGSVEVGNSFEWTLTVNNTGEASAVFNSENILRDHLPNGLSYADTTNLPVVKGGGTTGDIDCDIQSSNNYLDCDDNGGGSVVTIPAGGWFSVTITATSDDATTLDNPRSGRNTMCRVDPDTEIAESNEQNNECSDTVEVTNVIPLPNPPLIQACGLDIALVLDVSGSINDTELGQMKTAFNSFVDAFLPATPTQFSITEFSSSANVLQSFTGDATTAKTAINSADGSGSTNWEDALAKAQSTFDPRVNPNMVIFASDGNPNRAGTGPTYDASPDGSPAAMNPAITQANAIKTAGTHILTLGIGDNLDVANLEAISGSGDVITSDFSNLATKLADLAAELCGGTITAKKLVDADGDLNTTDDQTPAEGWTFDVNGTVTDPAPVDTDVDGFTPAVEVEPGTYGITETVKDGYEVLDAECTVNNQTIGTRNGNAVTGMTIGANDIVSCTFINAEIPEDPILRVTKYATNDDGGTVLAKDFNIKLNGNSLGSPDAYNDTAPTSTATYNDIVLEAGVTSTISEHLPNGYTNDSINCWDITNGLDNAPIVGNGFTPELAHEYLCNVQNNDKPTTITINKVVENNYGGNDTADDFQGLVDFNAIEWGQSIAITPGWHRVSEAWWENLGYSGGSWSGDCYSSGWIHISFGGTYECEITNYDKPAKVLLWKHVTNDDGGTAKAGDFTLEVGGESGTIGDWVELYSNTPHHVYEDPGYEYEWVDTSCYALDLSGKHIIKQLEIPIVLDEGQIAKCIFYNDDIPRSTVDVYKYHDVNQNGTWDNDEPALEDWEFTLNCDDYGQNNLAAVQPCEDYGPEMTDTDGKVQFEDVLHGDYVLSESVQDGWLAGDIECSVGERRLKSGPHGYLYGSYYLYIPEGAEVTCHVGNYQDAELMIEKTNDQIGNVLSAGDVVNYTIDVANPVTSGVVYDAVVHDLLPEGFDYVAGSWSASSSVRGDITGMMSEPDYSSNVPAQWHLGDLVVGEYVTLTYSVTIDASVTNGVHDNIAYVAGCAMMHVPYYDGLRIDIEVDDSPEYELCKQEEEVDVEQFDIVALNDVLLPAPSGNVLAVVYGNGADDPFVESSVEVANAETPGQGYVLGLSTTGTPAILSVVLGSTVAVIGISLTRRKKFQLSKWFSGIGRSSAMLVLGLLAGSFLFTGVAFAASQLTVSQLTTPTTASSLSLAYQVATTDASNAFVVTLDVDGPGSNDYTTAKPVEYGSHSGTFTLNMPVDGSYEVTVTTDGATVANVQTVTRDATEPTEVTYNGVVRDGNTYTLSFEASTDAEKILIYASTETEFDANASTLVGEVDASATSFVYTAPDDAQRYFAVQAVDAAGNVSTLAGDTIESDENTDDTNETASSSNGTVDEDAATTDSDVEGASDQSDTESADDTLRNAALAVLAIGAALLVAYFIIRMTSQNKTEE